MRIACLGGGPAGLYFAISMKLRNADHDITVFERNRPDDTFGWGVVLSDDALSNVKENDPISYQSIVQEFAYWDDIAVVKDGQRQASSGHGFCGIGRMQLLKVLYARAEELGVNLQFQSSVDDTQTLMDEYDLVVAADGLNSKSRDQFKDVFKPEIDTRPCQFVWLGTHQKFDQAFTFIFEETQHGWVWAHAYQFSEDTATFIVECSQSTWEKWGFGDMSQQENITVCEEIFKEHLNGNALMTNANHIRGSAWMNFPRVLCERWHHKNLVLMGDASATAHFSIGSGSRLAFDSAIALAEYLHQEDDMDKAFELYQEERRLDVLRLQSAARNSMEWFEQVERYLHLDPVQFNYALLTRSQRISHENLRLRDEKWVASAESWFEEQNGGPSTGRSPMFTSYQLADLTLNNRVVVSPMAQYKANNDGMPNDWHLVHYGNLAKGGAGLVYTEMTCVSDTGRITQGCPGLYTQAQADAWQKVVAFVHDHTDAKLCVQLGHSGPKGSTQLGWQIMDAPLEHDNWPLLAASAVPWSDNNATPKAMDATDMTSVCDDFVAATKRAVAAGFDMIEVHCAHGYLLSSFITPLTNKRDDEFGGCLENRLRYPLQVVSAVKAVLPSGMPLSVRISANDWMGDAGITPDEAVLIAAAFKAIGVDIIDVSAGQTSVDAQPVYGRMFQTPFADRIRHEAGIPTMAVGNIFEPDHVNSILMAGRADLVCLGRPHLANANWTNQAAITLGDQQQSWPQPYLAGREQAYRLAERAEQMTIRA